MNAPARVSSGPSPDTTFKPQFSGAGGRPLRSFAYDSPLNAHAKTGGYGIRYQPLLDHVIAFRDQFFAGLMVAILISMATSEDCARTGYSASRDDATPPRVPIRRR